MKGISATAIFCEDIRDEVQGTHSLIGIISDNIHVPALPGVMPKLALYARIRIDGDIKVKSLRLSMSGPSVGEIGGDELDETKITDLRKGATGPFSTLLSRIVVSPLPINKVGLINAILTIDGKKEVIGYLNIQTERGDSESGKA